MRRLFSIFGFFIIACMLSTTTSAFATGDGNIDNGGGDMGQGNSQNKWSPGDDGVRITVIRASDEMPVSTPMDYTNKTIPENLLHFGKVSKIHYRNGANLTPKNGGYIYIKARQPIPKIISSGSSPSNIEVIKSYFTDEQVIRSIASSSGIDFDTLTNGNYRLLLEPIAYFTFQGSKVGMTAHEAALYDQVLSGRLRSKMVSLTHQNLPLAMFLEKPDLSFPAWSGSSSDRVTNAQIISSLGLGIVRFKELPPPPPPPVESDAEYEYRTDTEVITSVFLSTGEQITPEDPAQVTFSVMGSSYTVTDIVIPEGDSQVVWFKWQTPRTPQMVTIHVSTSQGRLSQQTIQANIVDLDQNPPPNPTATDRNDSFKLPTLPSHPQKTTASWGVWSASWHANWVWISNWVWHGTGDGGGYWVDHGHWEDQGWWDYHWTSYIASLSATHTVKPDDKVPTASGKTMKSGYGIQMNVNTSLASNAPASHITGAQHAVAYFPEFQFSTYWRLYDRITGGYQAAFELKPNKYSTYNRRVHFTPIWFPDGIYEPYTEIIDAWTPDGMLQVNVSDQIQIKENLYSDWHIAPKK
nr:hypothetical protein [Brevibacillus borstelensis]